MSDKIEVNRRRVLGGLVTIGAAGAAVGAGTFAWFSDTETSNNNNITSGTLSLSGATDGEFSVSEVAPSQRIPETGVNTIQATYDSTSTIAPVEVDLDVSIDEPSSEPSGNDNTSDQTASAFAQQLTVETAETRRNGSRETDLTTSPQSVSNVDDLAGTTIDDAFGEVGTGDTVSLALAVTFNSSAGNDYQADGVSITAEFTAEQPAEDSP